MAQQSPGADLERNTPNVRYPISTDGLGTGSGGISFEEYAYTYAVEHKLVQPESMKLQIVGHLGGRPAMNELMLNRAVDIGVISLATAIRGIHEGLNLRVLCRDKVFHPGGNSVYVQASSKIKSARDLGSASAVSFHCAPDSERLVAQRGILEKKYGLRWSNVPAIEGS
ncbi:MAG: hypothetical protein GTO51_09465 [Candidatus Latescibacteria bacterium]|nr:hypothetical protein [Candidatus Latescibacterota bacterium]NIM66199.1 hypothetical protein [Candidatus Latescibacterota bacterium]NIO02720.1 hypothetical protein [Candidatus Latescibacterota bacterium]NIT38079.1 hypothetical protein [Candidatus Latescibacterota bacterium]